MITETRGFPCKEVIAACEAVAEDIAVRIGKTIADIRQNAIIPATDDKSADPFAHIQNSFKEIHHQSYSGSVDAINMQLVAATKSAAEISRDLHRSSVLVSPSAQELLIPYMD